MNIDHKKSFCIIFLLIVVLTGDSQNSFQNKFSKLYNFTILPRTNVNFKEYYEITIKQNLNHTDPKRKFDQRIYIGFRDFNAPNLIVTDGYAIDYAEKKEYSNELAKELNANLIVVEHRFCGRSIPDSSDWSLLTVKQAADDYHFIKTILDTLLTGKWISTGISKGGQAALGYKMNYPEDVVATVVYGTAVKNKQTVMTDSLLFNLSQTRCGKKINELQLYLFKHKKELLPEFSNYVAVKLYEFKPLDNEIVFDYLLLELPFSYWQNGNLCESIPDTLATPSRLVSYVTNIVPPRFFSEGNKVQLEASFYMFYHEFGYYEYSITPFIKYLKQNNYSNKYFAPKVPVEFENTYQKALQKFMKSKSSENIFFIYGENDPWALQTTVSENVFTVQDGSHKSRIADLGVEEENAFYEEIKKLIH